MWRAFIAFEKRMLLAAIAIGRRPEDQDAERVRKAVLAIFALFMAGGAPIEMWMALERGRSDSAMLMGAWGGLSLVCLVHFGVTGQRRLLQTSQLAMTIVVSALTHLFMGGFEASQGMVLWGAMAPLGALLLCSRREAYGWMAAYLAASTTALLLADVGGGSEASQRVFSTFGIVHGLPLTVFVLVWYFVSEIERARAALTAKHALLEIEQAKSERLLLNLLPEPIARRLKDEDKTIADGFDLVTVLFADIVGFTALSSRVSPEELVAMLNRVFSAFDEAAERHGIEKIKTIGDAYMAAAGLPQAQPDQAEAMAAMALDMQSELKALNAELGTDLDIRIGLHSGPVVAGVIGKRKFIYDLWGDTVNVASRMESHGEPGRIQVSGAVHAMLGDSWRFEPRGEIQVKGKGAMSAYFLLGRSEA